MMRLKTDTRDAFLYSEELPARQTRRVASRRAEAFRGKILRKLKSPKQASKPRSSVKLDALGIQVGEHTSRSGKGFIVTACVPDVPTAMFYAPLNYGWSEADYEVEKAVKEYLEDNHADR